MHKRLKH